MRVLIFFLILLPLTVSADYWFAEIGAGSHESWTGDGVPWENAGEAGCSLAVGRSVSVSESASIVFGWWHYSQCLAGPPFNDHTEATLDAVSIRYQYRWGD